MTPAFSQSEFAHWCFLSLFLVKLRFLSRQSTKQLRRHDSNLAPPQPAFYGLGMLSCPLVPRYNPIERNCTREAYENEVYVYGFVLPPSCYVYSSMDRCLIYPPSI
ncbi:hypothetical protein ACN38_g450 [Penicillium nordicum]|uniref:Uncharacterized protein n=1 Tax=Penicillium nordicum TaxID=229535 RepID=A0A0M8PA96_9EURO|nr:hypothetical protein ACN38_g450 [Penicillium nordicum]